MTKDEIEAAAVGLEQYADTLDEAVPEEAAALAQIGAAVTTLRGCATFLEEAGVSTAILRAAGRNAVDAVRSLRVIAGPGGGAADAVLAQADLFDEP